MCIPSCRYHLHPFLWIIAGTSESGSDDATHPFVWPVPPAAPAVICLGCWMLSPNAVAKCPPALLAQRRNLVWADLSRIASALLVLKASGSLLDSDIYASILVCSPVCMPAACTACDVCAVRRHKSRARMTAHQSRGRGGDMRETLHAQAEG